MNTSILICYIIYNFFHILITCKCTDIFLEYKNQRKSLKIAAVLSYYAVNTLLFLRYSSYAVNIATNIIPMFLYSLLYKGKLYKRIFYVVSVYSLSMVLEDFIYFMLEFLFGGFDLKAIILFYAAFDLLFYGIYCLLKKIIINISGSDLRFKHMLPLLFVPVCLIFFTQTFVDSEFTVNRFVVFAFMLTVCLLVFYCFYEIDKSYKNIYKEYVLENENQYYENQFDIIKNSDAEARKLRHDYKNHMIALKNYILNDNKEESIKYIDNLTGNIDYERQIAKSKNIVIDSLINHKFRNYKENNISLDLNIFVPEALFVTDYDLNIILGNLIDNALTAVKKADKREISIIIKIIDKALFIRNGKHL